MAKTKLQVGYGSDRREGSTKKGLYGGKRTGKNNINGGFNNGIVVDFTRISEDKWNSIFGTENLPKWKRELLEKGESLD